MHPGGSTAGPPRGLHPGCTAATVQPSSERACAPGVSFGGRNSPFRPPQNSLHASWFLHNVCCRLELPPAVAPLRMPFITGQGRLISQGWRGRGGGAVAARALAEQLVKSGWAEKNTLLVKAVDVVDSARWRRLKTHGQRRARRRCGGAGAGGSGAKVGVRAGGWVPRLAPRNGRGGCAKKGIRHAVWGLRDVGREPGE